MATSKGREIRIEPVPQPADYLTSSRDQVHGPNLAVCQLDRCAIQTRACSASRALSPAFSCKPLPCTIIRNDRAPPLARQTQPLAKPANHVQRSRWLRTVPLVESVTCQPDRFKSADRASSQADSRKASRCCYLMPSVGAEVRE